MHTKQKSTTNPKLSIAEYYDRNTRSFLRFGQSGSELAIHRGVWANGVENAAEAARWANLRILKLCAELKAERVLDLGCGVGGSAILLTTHMPGLQAWGLTISADQVTIGTDLARNRGLDNRVHLRLADFTLPIEGIPPQDCVFAVESLIHVPNLEAVMSNVAGLLRPGGCFIVCDDFLNDDWERRFPSSIFRHRKNIAAFRDCWHGYGLRRKGELIASAGRKGLALVDDEDLTPQLRLRRGRDIAIQAVVPLMRGVARKSAWAQNLVGGNALNTLLRHGVMSYRFLVFSRIVE